MKGADGRKGRRKKRPHGYGSVYKRNSIWWYAPTGQPARSSDSTRREDAEAMLDKLVAEQRVGRGADVDPTRATYEDLEALLLADLKANKRRSLHDVEKSRLPHLRAFFSGMLAREIRFDTVTAYVARRLDKKAAAATVSYETKLLRRMLRLACRAGKVARLPDLPTVAVGDNARKGFASPEDIERVIGHLPDHAKGPVRCMYLTGWRTGEVLGLTWARVDIEAGTLRLAAADTKTGRARSFPFADLPALAALLREQRELTSALEREQGAIIPAVFHEDGQPFRSFRSAWRTAVKAAGLPGLRPHDLRRSAARNLVRAGVSEGVVMKLCGWTTRHMFDRYNVADERDLKDGVGRLGAFLEARAVAARRAAKP